jgi:hypothetical protein
VRGRFISRRQSDDGGTPDLGHLITDDGHDWLIGVHVPLAFVIFGLTTWLTVQSIRLSRREPR